MVANAVDMRTKDEQDGSVVSGSPVKRNQLLQVCFYSGAFAVRWGWTGRLNLDHNEVAIHSTRNVDQQVRSREMEVSATNQRISIFVDFAAKRVPPIGPRAAQAVVKLICVDPLAVLDQWLLSLNIGDGQCEVVTPYRLSRPSQYRAKSID